MWRGFVLEKARMIGMFSNVRGISTHARRDGNGNVTEKAQKVLDTIARYKR